MILGIDPANEYSAFVVVENDLSAVVDKEKFLIKNCKIKYQIGKQRIIQLIM